MSNVNRVDQANNQNPELSQTQQVSAVVNQIKDAKSDARTQVQMVLQKGNTAEIGMELVKRSAQVVAQSAVMSKSFLKNIDPDMKRDFDQIFQARSLDTEDQVQLQGGVHKTDASQKTAEEKHRQVLQQQNIPLEGDAKKLLEDYTKLFTMASQHQTPEIQKELKKLEGQLFARGIKSTQLKAIQMSLMGSLRSEIAVQIKQAFMNRMLSTDELVEMAIHTRGLNDILDFVWTNPKLGGADFGGYNTDLQGTMDRIMEETQTELKSFIRELLKEKMTRKLLANTPEEKAEVRDELKDALKIAKRLGFDLNAFVARWQKEKIQEGLFLFENPQKQGVLDTLAGGMAQRNFQQNQNQSQSSEGAETTEDLLINRLRALHMRNALKGDLFTRLDTAFKIRKTKNGLIRLGIYSNDLNEKVKKEAENVAKLKTMEMIKECLYEMATLFELSGTAFTLVETKMKGLLRNAQRLNLDIGPEDLLALRDKCNLEVLEVVKREHKLTRVAYEVTHQIALANKIAGLEKLIRRLNSETKVISDLEDEPIQAAESSLQSAV